MGYVGIYSGAVQVASLPNPPPRFGAESPSGRDGLYYINWLGLYYNPPNVPYSPNTYTFSGHVANRGCCGIGKPGMTEEEILNPRESLKFHEMDFDGEKLGNCDWVYDWIERKARAFIAAGRIANQTIQEAKEAEEFCSLERFEYRPFYRRVRLHDGTIADVKSIRAEVVGYSGRTQNVILTVEKPTGAHVEVPENQIEIVE